MKEEKCKELSDHDTENPKRIGRCNYRCRRCDEDISMLIILIEEAKRK